MNVHIDISYKGAEVRRDFETDHLLIGRLGRKGGPGLDLSIDTCVSRRHALVEIKDGACWLTDLGSRCGTQVNGREIRAQGECEIQPGDTVRIGETLLHFTTLEPDPLANTVAPAPPPSDPAGARASSDMADLAASFDEDPDTAEAVSIVTALDTKRALVSGADCGGSPTERRLALMLELPNRLVCRLFLLKNFVQYSLQNRPCRFSCCQ